MLYNPVESIFEFVQLNTLNEYQQVQYVVTYDDSLEIDIIEKRIFNDSLELIKKECITHLSAQDYFNDSAYFIHNLKNELKDLFVYGLTCEVYKSVYDNGTVKDCTNNGISSNKESLILIKGKKCGPVKVDRLDDCVCLDKRKLSFLDELYVTVKPIINKNRHYMYGGNILCSSDSRFREISGVPYPLKIHDRLES